MTPEMISSDIRFTLEEMSSTKLMDSMAPTKEAKMSTTDPTATPRERKPMRVNDKISFAPEEMPRMKGPAIGLAKKVWSRKPERARAPPSRAAAKMRGRRMLPTMTVLSPPQPRRMDTISPGDTWTLPAFTFQTTRAASPSSRARKPSMSRVRFSITCLRPSAYVDR